jgi:hypothetical protein
VEVEVVEMEMKVQGGEEMETPKKKLDLKRTSQKV